jgi:ubiquinone/menaquinone biosynthesis C-methylase UbiE
MKIKVTHEKQQEIWDKEHKNPTVLLQMDASTPSSGVTKFWEWVKKENRTSDLHKGLEMGCGKGRSVIWLSQQGVEMTGFDFSPFAIQEAKKRAKKAQADKAHFVVQDATITWDFKSDSFDFAIDCFASTDIESREGRDFAISEMIRVVKPKGLILVYVLSTEDEFYKEMIKKSPVDEKNAFVHPTGKFEKTYDREELLNLYKGLSIVIEERFPKKTTFNGKEYDCYHHWIVFEKN